MSLSLVEKEYKQLLDDQMSQASGMRLEQLKKQGEGERKLLMDIIWPVRKTFKGLILEKEIVTLTGVKAYIDVFEDAFRLGFEGEGFVSHAESITRPRFDFEKLKIRSMVAYGIKYTPFTYDEMDKKPEQCRRNLYEIYGRLGANAGSVSYQTVSLYEREVIRYAMYLCRPIRMSDVKECLQKGEDKCRFILRSLVEKGLVKPLRAENQRIHEYVLEEDVYKCLW